VARVANRLYVLELEVAHPICLMAQGDNAAWRWHAQYDHLNFHGLRQLSKEDMVKGLPQIDHIDQVCDSCLTGKQHRRPFPTEAKYRATRKIELVHGDLYGPVTPATPSGSRYFFVLVDDLSRFMWVTLMSTKDQAMRAFIGFQALAQSKARTKLGTLRTDRGGEFTARSFVEDCTREGIQRHLTAPHTPEQNDVVER
jgi:transposase InsO family protein